MNSSTEELNLYVNQQVQSAMNTFNEELSTDENKDYRRGYRAGVLFAYLHIKSNIGNLTDASTEQPTD